MRTRAMESIWNKKMPLFRREKKSTKRDWLKKEKWNVTVNEKEIDTNLLNLLIFCQVFYQVFYECFFD